mmetsp:Transcript_10066/g.14548  ORF Transcript_10066/g.14548 Transcript_10066/m.14548 type:complete len:86 (+) Transcript_10066:587-844(+)
MLQPAHFKVLLVAEDCIMEEHELQNCRIEEPVKGACDKHLQRKVALRHICLDSITVSGESSILEVAVLTNSIPNVFARYLAAPKI